MRTVRWQDDAACRGREDLDWFGDDLTFSTARLCEDCPVRLPCLMEALPRDDYEDVGVWGGTSPAQRRAIRRGRLTVEAAWAQKVLS